MMEMIYFKTTGSDYHRSNELDVLEDHPIAKRISRDESAVGNHQPSYGRSARPRIEPDRMMIELLSLLPCLSKGDLISFLSNNHFLEEKKRKQ